MAGGKYSKEGKITKYPRMIQMNRVEKTTMRERKEEHFSTAEVKLTLKLPRLPTDILSSSSEI